MNPRPQPEPRSDPRAPAVGPFWSRPENWIVALYALFAAAWIAFSDLALSALFTTPEQLATASTIKGFGFVAVTASLLHGTLRRVLASERDARKRSASSEGLLSALADAIAVPVFLKDRDSRWIFSNRATLTVLGKRMDEVIGKTDAEIYADPAIARALMENDRRIMESGAPASVEETIETPGGRRVYLSSKAPYRDPDGRIVGIIGNAQDITERRDAEEALRGQLALREQFTRIAESVPGLIYSFRLHPDGRANLPFTTAALEDVFGLPAEALALDIAPWSANVHPEDLPRVMAGVTESARTLSRWHAEFRYHHPVKGLRWIEGWSIPLREADGCILWHGYVTDVTEHRWLRDQVQSAQRLESIGRLAGGIAHDFNNLLTAILGSVSVLEKRAGGLDERDELQEIQAAALRATDLTRQLLAFARRQVISPVALDLNGVLRSSERLLRRLLGEDVELVVRPQDGLWRVKADAGQLEQVVINLAVNARDAMPSGGRLVLETRNDDGGGVPAAVRAALPGPVVGLLVRDTGSGMTPEVREHLFEPFFTTKAAGAGTGLGLATVHGIVSQLGGRIHVESTLGQGTTFTVWFPQTVDAAAPIAATAPRQAGKVQGTETILVVEDDPMVRAVTVRALSHEGYRVIVAASGEEAIALQDDVLRGARLLVTDMVMPGIDGRRVAETLRRRNPGLRVLFVSGYSPDAVAERGLLEPGFQLLEKPFLPDALAARVRAILDDGAPPTA